MWLWCVSVWVCVRFIFVFFLRCHEIYSRPNAKRRRKKSVTLKVGAATTSLCNIYCQYPCNDELMYISHLMWCFWLFFFPARCWNLIGWGCLPVSFFSLCLLILCRCRKITTSNKNSSSGNFGCSYQAHISWMKSLMCCRLTVLLLPVLLLFV